MTFYLLTCCIAHYQPNYDDRTGRHGTEVEVGHGVEIMQTPGFGKDNFGAVTSSSMPGLVFFI